MNTDAAREVLRKRARMRRQGLVLHAASVLFGVSCVSAAVSDDYARAERFLPWNRDRYVANADIQHHWIEGQDRFWYVRTNAAGEKEFILVDAQTGKQSTAFDQRAFAASLSKATNSTVSPGEVLSPDGRWAVSRRDHNLWARRPEAGQAVPLTTDGIENYEYATYPIDRVTFQRNHPERVPPELIWSPDSRRILTYRLDERKVADYYLVQATPGDSAARPQLYRYRYPLPGDENISELQLRIIDVDTARSIVLDTPPLPVAFSSVIKMRAAWWSADGSKVYFLRRDRFAKSLSLEVADAATGRVRELIHESSPTPISNPDGGVLSTPSVRMLANGDIIWYSARDGWGHLYYYEGATGRLRNQITRGAWAVRRIVRIDESQGRLYFMASGREPGDPYEQHLYSIRFDSSGIRLLTPEEGEHALASLPFETSPRELAPTAGELEPFSPSGRYFVDSFSRPDVPPVLVLRTSAGRLVKQLERADIANLRAGGYVPIEPFRALAADGKTAIFGNLYRPSTFDPARKYPVIDSVYPGPQTTRVAKSFSAAVFDVFYAQSLAELGFIVVAVDGRGTPRTSKAFLDYSYGRLSRASELDDHIAAIRELARRYPFMDLDRVGVWGVSAGGFASARAILAYPDFYKVAVSASGNSSDQRSAPAGWVETWIGPVGASDYAEASNLPLAGQLKGKLLLMYGELDDRCPPYLTTQLVDALIKANRTFDLLVMPNENHQAFLSPYFIRRQWDYFVRNLAGAEPPADYEIRRPQQH
jgi:dipeptidyl aminopeptidase/acylaminoacyl peptidase